MERTSLEVLAENLRSGSEIPGQTLGGGQVSVSEKVPVMLAVRNSSQM